MWLWVVLVVLLLLAAGAAAYYLLSAPTQTTVPRVVGKPLSVAKPTLQHAGFKVRLTYRRSDRRAGFVLGESPAGGSQADPGSTITLKVSKGRGMVTVPQVQGFRLAAAEAAIRKAGLRVGKVQSVNDSQFPAGEVSSTTPFAGQPEPPGTLVNVFVSAGPAKKTVPNVTGETESAARSTLTQAGFTVQPVFTISKQTPGTVISQTPTGNTQAPPGSLVTINIAKAAAPPPPSTATVPSVTGDTLAAAESALKAAGFTPVVTQQTVTSKSQNGIVLSQSPPGNSSAKKGSTVTIVVGRYKKPGHTTTTTGTNNPPPPLIPGL